MNPPSGCPSRNRKLTPAQYSKLYLEQLLPEAKVVPAVNQIENHPSLPQDEIVDLCKAKGIQIMAYSPFGSTGAPIMTAPVIVKIAEKHGVSAGTILLSYHSEFLSMKPFSLFFARLC